MSANQKQTPFVNVLEDALDYNMDHKHPGKCLIFDHEHFEKHKPRHGTKVDVQRITTFFEKKLGFETNTYYDLSVKSLLDQTLKMSKQDFSEYNCFVCCILTHGSDTDLWAYDNNYKLDQVLSFFTAEHCPTLAAKPKLFFIQACQGKNTDPGHPVQMLSNDNNKTVQSSSTVVTDGQSEATAQPTVVTVRIPIFADILVAHSTAHNYYSFRDKLKGSWFFEVLIETFEQHFQTRDLITMLTLAKQKIALKKSHCGRKQVPMISDTLTRTVRFKPKTQLTLDNLTLDDFNQ